MGWYNRIFVFPDFQLFKGDIYRSTDKVPLWLFMLAVPFDVFEELDGVSFTHTLFFFKSINLPISHLFSIFGAVFGTKHGAKIHNSVLTTKYFGNYFSIFCIMSAKNDVSSRFIAALECLLGDNIVTDKKAFAQKVGISPSMITEIYKGRSAVGTTAIQNIVRVFNISGDWLLTGEGEMLKSHHSEPSKAPSTAKKSKDQEIGDSHQTPSQPTASSSMPTTSAGIHKLPQGSQKGIPLIPVSAMAGAFTSDISVMEYECERYVVPSFEGADFLIPVKGDSMQPTYLSGDLVACQKMSLADIFFQWNKTYVLDTDQGALIKRVCQGSDTDHILLVSDNECYPPFELSLSHLHAIALVRGIIRLE